MTHGCVQSAAKNVPLDPRNQTWGHESVRRTLLLLLTLLYLSHSCICSYSSSIHHGVWYTLYIQSILCMLVCLYACLLYISCLDDGFVIRAGRTPCDDHHLTGSGGPQSPRCDWLDPASNHTASLRCISQTGREWRCGMTSFEHRVSHTGGKNEREREREQ